MTYQKQRFEARIATEELIEKYFDPAVTLAKCRACRGFALHLVLPDFDFDPLDFWKGFSRFHLIVDRISNEGAASVAAGKGPSFGGKVPIRCGDAGTGKRTAWKLCPSRAGMCPLYKNAPASQESPRLHLEQMRYALESLGMLAVNLVKDQFGFDVLLVRRQKAFPLITSWSAVS